MNRKLTTKPVLRLFEEYPRGSQRYKGADALVLAKFFIRGTDMAFYVLEAEPLEVDEPLAKYTLKWNSPKTYELRGISVNLSEDEDDSAGAYFEAPLAEFEIKFTHVLTQVTPDGRQLYARRYFERDDDWTGKKHVADIEGLNMLFDREQAEMEALADRFAEYELDGKKAQAEQQKREQLQEPEQGQK